jgi:peptidoglycan hydrolase-like protein with peptidoglycan-binding domain
VDYPRDLGQVELWQESLERSLARRGRTKHSSIELYRLRGEQELTLEEMVLDSSQYSHLRRRAADYPLRPRAAVAASGVSALTLVAVATLPGLLGGRAASKERIAYAAKVRGRGHLGKGQASSALQPRSMPARALTGDATLVGFRHRGAPMLSVTESTQQLQRRLGVVADGEFGPITLRAVKGFQLSHGLVVDGIVGPATRAALGLPAGPVLRANPIYFPKPVKPARHVTRTAPKPVHHQAPPRPHPAPQSLSIAATIRLMQERLGVPADGEFGPVTFRALKAFQAHHGLVVDGILGPATRRALGLPPGPVLHANPALFPRHRATRQGGPTTHHAPRPKPPVHHSPPPAKPSTGYVNPLAHASVTPERIDAGVDYSGTGTLTALGGGRVTYVGTSGTGWPGAFVEYQLLNGPDAGRYVYYAEGVRPAVSVGQVVQAGQAVAYLIRGWSSGIEIGWGSGVGTQPLAQKLGEYSFPTAAGESFSALIASLGGPPGIP